MYSKTLKMSPTLTVPISPQRLAKKTGGNVRFPAAACDKVIWKWRCNVFTATQPKGFHFQSGETEIAVL